MGAQRKEEASHEEGVKCKELMKPKMQDCKDFDEEV